MQVTAEQSSNNAHAVDLFWKKHSDIQLFENKDW